MATSTAIIRAALDPTGTKIVFRGYSQEFIEFARSLPDAKFDRVSSAWSCLLTPAAAYRTLAFPDMQCADKLTNYAWKQHEALQRAANCRAVMGGLQPPLRKTQAWRHQADAYWFTNILDAALLAMGMGTGKSKTICDTLANSDAETVLILCPKSVLGVWRREFERHCARAAELLILDSGTVTNKVAQTILFYSHGRGRGRLKVTVVNYESARMDPLARWLLQADWDAVICDESHRIKTHNSAISKFCYKLGRKAQRRYCLTGTPLGQSPLDVFGQFRFLDPGWFGTSWHEFNQRYAVHSNPAIPQMVTGYKNQEELQQRMANITFRVTAEEVLDLPARHHIDRTFPLGKEARRVYREMAEEMIAQVRDGVCTAANAMVKIIRLAQVTSGYLPLDDDGPLERIDDAKQNVLVELLEDLEGEPVVVFCRFREDLARVAEMADKLGRRYGELSGRRRDALDDRGCLRNGVTLAGVQYQSGGVGIDLTRAAYCVFYSPCHSLTDFDQAIARLHRPGQTRPTHFYHLIGEKTVEVDIYRALKNRREVIDEILSIFKQGEVPHEQSE